MNRLFRFVVIGLAALPLALAGCSNEYSPTVRYGVRTDPVMIAPGAKLGDERYDPDRPGVLPISLLKDVSEPDHPYYAKKDGLDKVFFDPLTLSQSQRDEVEKTLELVFGTPARPTVNAKEAEIDPKIISDLKLDDATLAKGSSRYRIHCMHCHGVAGDGRGPTSRWINPHPRDFRPALFKFQSSDKDKSQLPQRSDLVRTVRFGLEGTAMPSFNLLADDEIDALVSYVIHLSLRGESEYSAFREFAEDKAIELPTSIKFYAKQRAGFWHNAQAPEVAIKVTPDEAPADLKPEVALKESVLRGKQIFNASISDEFKKYHALKTLRAQKKAAKITKEELASLEKAASEPEAMKKAELYLKGAGCVTCHVDYGRQAKFRFDDWGTLVRPNNFTMGNFRGGKRPVDIYYRIHSGIRGSGMQGFYSSFKDHPEYLWDLVNFVGTLSYPAMRDRLDLKID